MWVQKEQYILSWAAYPQQINLSQSLERDLQEFTTCQALAEHSLSSGVGGGGQSIIRANQLKSLLYGLRISVYSTNVLL